MDLKELFAKVVEIGEMPKVRIDKPVRHSEFTEGTVTQIRPTGIIINAVI